MFVVAILAFLSTLTVTWADPMLHNDMIHLHDRNSSSHSETTQQLRTDFKIADVNHDGRLSRTEFASYLEQVETAPTGANSTPNGMILSYLENEGKSSVFYTVWTDNGLSEDGTVDENEFVHYWIQLFESQEEEQGEDEPDLENFPCIMSVARTPSCSFDTGFCSFSSYSEGNTGSGWVLSNGTAGPINQDWQPTNRSGAYVYLAVDPPSVSHSSRAVLSTYLAPADYNTVCIEFRYATSGRLNHTIRIYNQKQKDYSSGSRSQDTLIGQLTDVSTNGQWKTASFTSCVHYDSYVAFEGKKVSPTSTVALDYIKIRFGSANCPTTTTAPTSTMSAASTNTTGNTKLAMLDASAATPPVSTMTPAIPTTNILLRKLQTGSVPPAPPPTPRTTTPTTSTGTTTVPDQTASNPSLRATIKVQNDVSTTTVLDDVPTTRKVESAPSTTALDDVPTTRKAESAPSTTALDDVPTTRKVESAPSTTALDGVPTTRKVESAPSTTALDGVPTTRKVDIASSTTALHNVPTTMDVSSDSTFKERDHVTTNVDINTASMPNEQDHVTTPVSFTTDSFTTEPDHTTTPVSFTTDSFTTEPDHTTTPVSFTTDSFTTEPDHTTAPVSFTTDSFTTEPDHTTTPVSVTTDSFTAEPDHTTAPVSFNTDSFTNEPDHATTTVSFNADSVTTEPYHTTSTFGTVTTSSLRVYATPVLTTTDLTTSASSVTEPDNTTTTLKYATVSATTELDNVSTTSIPSASNSTERMQGQDLMCTNGTVDELSCNFTQTSCAYESVSAPGEGSLWQFVSGVGGVRIPQNDNNSNAVLSATVGSEVSAVCIELQYTFALALPDQTLAICNQRHPGLVTGADDVLLGQVVVPSLTVSYSGNLSISACVVGGSYIVIRTRRDLGETILHNITVTRSTMNCPDNDPSTTSKSPTTESSTRSTSTATRPAKCGRIVIETSEYGTFAWPTSDVGTHVEIPCPYNYPGNYTIVARECTMVNITAMWTTVDYSVCPTEKDLTKLSPQEIFTQPVSPETAQATSKFLQVFTTNKTSVTTARAGQVVDTLEQLVTEETLAAPEVVTNVVQSINNLIEVHEMSLDTAAAENAVVARRLLQLIDSVPEKAPLEKGQLKMVTPNLIIAAQGINESETRDVILSVDSKSRSDLHNDTLSVDLSEGNTSHISSGTGVVIPTKAILGSLTAQQRQKLSRVAFVVQKSSKLFASAERTTKSDSIPRNDTSLGKGGPVNGNTSSVTAQSAVRMRVNSKVISASVPGVKVKNLTTNIVLYFEHSDTNAANASCVFWHESASNDSGRWSSVGCTVLDSDGGRTTCGCNHLTNFALLMDIYQEGGGLSELDDQILSVISYIGCGISTAGLFLTILSYCLIRKLMRGIPSQILMNLCTALLASNLIYLIGMHDFSFHETSSCKVVAVLLHYTLLASLTWMAVEAFYMYLALVVVFKTYFVNLLLKCCLIGWGVPLLVVAITLAVDSTDNYGFINSGLCWLKNPAFYAAFVGPVCLILLLNCIAFALVVKQLFNVSGGRFKKSDRSSTKFRLRGAVGVVILLGLSWLFAVLAIDQASVAFYYLFAIFNSFQGLFIFIFYCLMKHEVRKVYIDLLCCHVAHLKTYTVSPSKSVSGSDESRDQRRRPRSDSTFMSSSTSSTRVESSKDFSASVSGRADKESPSLIPVPNSTRAAPSPLQEPQSQRDLPMKGSPGYQNIELTELPKDAKGDNSQEARNDPAVDRDAEVNSGAEQSRERTEGCYTLAQKVPEQLPQTIDFSAPQLESKGNLSNAGGNQNRVAAIPAVINPNFNTQSSSPHVQTKKISGIADETDGDRASHGSAEGDNQSKENTQIDSGILRGSTDPRPRSESESQRRSEPLGANHEDISDGFRQESAAQNTRDIQKDSQTGHENSLYKADKTSACTEQSKSMDAQEDKFPYENQLPALEANETRPYSYSFDKTVLRRVSVGDEPLTGNLVLQNGLEINAENLIEEEVDLRDIVLVTAHGKRRHPRYVKKQRVKPRTHRSLSVDTFTEPIRSGTVSDLLQARQLKINNGADSNKIALKIKPKESVQTAHFF